MKKARVNAPPERDPRVDPQTGDVLITPQGLTRTVTSLELGGRVVHFITESKRAGSCHVLAWGSWCRKQRAAVLKDNLFV